MSFYQVAYKVNNKSSADAWRSYLICLVWLSLSLSRSLALRLHRWNHTRSAKIKTKRSNTKKQIEKKLKVSKAFNSHRIKQPKTIKQQRKASILGTSMAKLSYTVAILLIWATIMMMGSYLTVEASGDLPWITPTTGLVFGDEEFELDSEINRRILATSNYISYGALQRNTVPCSRRGASYYNCQPGAQANPYSRGCSAITRCRS